MDKKRWLFGILAFGYLCVGVVMYWGHIGMIKDYPRIGFASWYTCSLTSNGEAMRDGELTCALRRRDYGRKYRVCNIETGACVMVWHNNWGPSERYVSEGRIVDLSKTAFAKLASLDKGIIPVTVEMVE